MPKIYLTVNLGEFDVYSLQAFSSKSDRKAYIRSLSKKGFSESDFVLMDVAVGTVSDCVWGAIQNYNYRVIDLKIFSAEKEAIAFIAKSNTDGFDSRNYSLLTIAVQQPRN